MPRLVGNTSRRADGRRQQGVSSLERSGVGQMERLIEVGHVDDQLWSGIGWPGRQAYGDAGSHRHMAHRAMSGKPGVGPAAEIGDPDRRGDGDVATHDSILLQDTPELKPRPPCVGVTNSR